MRKITALLVVAAFLMTLPASGFAWSLGFSANTGDKEFDATLSTMNKQASSDKSAFSLELSNLYKIPKPEVDDLLFKLKFSPADAYMTIRLALLSKKPISVVVGEYEANKGKGWGVIAKNLGIKPGSREFHELKNGASKSLITFETNKAKNNGKVKVKAKGKK